MTRINPAVAVVLWGKRWLMLRRTEFDFKEEDTMTTEGKVLVLVSPVGWGVHRRTKTARQNSPTTYGSLTFSASLAISPVDPLYMMEGADRLSDRS